MISTPYKRVVSISACLAVLFSICVLPVIAGGQSWVTVTRRAGVVESRLASSQSWLRIPNSRRLGLNDSVRTGAAGKAHLKLADNSVISLNPKTDVVLREFVLNKDRRSVKVDINNGQLRTQVSKFRGKDNRYQINSSNAVMAAQGTDFIVTVDNQGSTPVTTLRVINGTVLISGIDSMENPTLVQTGQTAVMSGTNATPEINTNVPTIGGQSADNEHHDDFGLLDGGDNNLTAKDSDSRGTMSNSTITDRPLSPSSDPHDIPVRPDNGGNHPPTGGVNIDLTPYQR